MANISAKSTIHYLASRETGLKISNKDTSEMLATRSKELRITNFFLTHTPINSIKDCNFIRSNFENGQIICAWHGSIVPGIIYQLNMNFRPNCSKDEFPSLIESIDKIEPQTTLSPIVDACFYKAHPTATDYIVYATYQSDEDKSSVMFSQFHRRVLDDDVEVYLQYLVKKEVFSCTYNFTKERFAVGTIEKLFIFDSFQFNCSETVSGNPTHLEFDKSGDIIYMGGSASGLRMYDMRLPFISDVIIQGFVTEFKLLSDENSIVLNDLDKLIWIDLRMRKRVFTYTGPPHIVLKIPFSVNESTDILCSTDHQNMTRVWSLSTGDVMYTIKPYDSRTTARSCIVSNGSNWGVALFQKNWMCILEP